MSERKLNHLSNLSHLLSATSNIIITNIIKFFLIFPIDRLSFGVKHSAWCNDSEFFGLSRNYFKLYWLEAASDAEEIAFLDWPVSILEVGDEIGFGEVSLESLDCISKWKHVNFGEIWDVTGRLDLNYISESHSKILPDSFVHSNLSFIEFVINKCDNQSFFSLFAFDEDGISFENFKLGHLGLAELYGRVLIVEGLFNLD